MAAASVALRPELTAARDRYRTMHLRTRDFRVLAAYEADSLDVGLRIVRFDLCSFWTAWEQDGLNSGKGLARLLKLLGVDADGDGALTVYKGIVHLQDVAGQHAVEAWTGFPFYGRYAPRSIRDMTAQLDHQYDDLTQRINELWDREP
jgi:hypothetical protein